MRRIKALFFASLLAAGPAFAGQDNVSTLELSDAYAMTEQENALVIPSEIAEVAAIIR